MDVFDRICGGAENVFLKESARTCGDLDFSQIQEKDKDALDHTFESVEEASLGCSTYGNRSGANEDREPAEAGKDEFMERICSPAAGCIEEQPERSHKQLDADDYSVLKMEQDWNEVDSLISNGSGETEPTAEPPMKARKYTKRVPAWKFLCCKSAVLKAVEDTH